MYYYTVSLDGLCKCSMILCEGFKLTGIKQRISSLHPSILPIMRDDGEIQRPYHNSSLAKRSVSSVHLLPNALTSAHGKIFTHVRIPPFASILSGKRM